MRLGLVGVRVGDGEEDVSVDAAARGVVEEVGRGRDQGETRHSGRCNAPTPTDIPVPVNLLGLRERPSPGPGELGRRRVAGEVIEDRVEVVAGPEVLQSCHRRHRRVRVAYDERSCVRSLFGAGRRG